MLRFIPGTSNHRVEGERKSNLPSNELDCNIKLHLVHHLETDNRPPAAGKYSIPDSKHSLCAGNMGGGKCVRDSTEMEQKSCSFSCSSHKLTAWLLFFFSIIIPTSTMHRGLAQGKGKELKTHLLLKFKSSFALANHSSPPGAAAHREQTRRSRLCE